MNSDPELEIEIMKNAFSLSLSYMCTEIKRDFVLYSVKTNYRDLPGLWLFTKNE